MDIDIILNEFTSPQEAVELGLMAERYGVRGVWSSNYGWSRDPFMTLSLLADRSSRIRMGPMAISAEELHPLKMANLLFSLNELSGGRAMIMVGGGGAVLQSIGKERRRMIRSVRECLRDPEGRSPDKTLNYDGDMYKVWGYKPAYATDEPPLIYYGANHPQSRRLAAELADGVITSDFVVPLMKEFVDATTPDLARRADRRGLRISNFWAWHIKEDAEASMREARRELMLRGWLGEQYFAPFLEPDEVEVHARPRAGFPERVPARHATTSKTCPRPGRQDDREHLFRRRTRSDRRGDRDATRVRGCRPDRDRAARARRSGRRCSPDRRTRRPGTEKLKADATACALM